MAGGQIFGKLRVLQTKRILLTGWFRTPSAYWLSAANWQFDS